jgi:hypothetical protein
MPTKKRAPKRKKNPGMAALPTGRGIQGVLRIVKRGRRRVATFRPNK